MCSEYYQEVLRAPAPRAFPEAALEVAPVGHIQAINNIDLFSVGRGDQSRINETVYLAQLGD